MSGRIPPPFETPSKAFSGGTAVSDTDVRSGSGRMVMEVDDPETLEIYSQGNLRATIQYPALPGESVFNLESGVVWVPSEENGGKWLPRPLNDQREVTPTSVDIMEIRLTSTTSGVEQTPLVMGTFEDQDGARRRVNLKAGFTTGYGGSLALAPWLSYVSGGDQSDSDVFGTYMTFAQGGVFEVGFRFVAAPVEARVLGDQTGASPPTYPPLRFGVFHVKFGFETSWENLEDENGDVFTGEDSRQYGAVCTDFCHNEDRNRVELKGRGTVSVAPGDNLMLWGSAGAVQRLPNLRAGTYFSVRALRLDPPPV